MLLSTHNVGLAWFAGPGREGIDHSGRIPSFLLLRNFEGDERMRHYGLDEQINHLRESGITFSIMSEDDARTFLRENTYYYKLKSYRHNYRRGDDGKFSCDFAHLVELSRMDIALSRLCLDHCLATEHALKVWLNAHLMEENDPGMADRILRESGVSWHAEQTPAPSNPYVEDLLQHCGTDRFLWHWWELGTFASQARLYSSYCHIKGQEAPLEHLLFIVRKLRNAVSHGSCLLSKVHIPAPVHAAGTDQETPFDNQVLRQGMWLCGRNPASKSVRKSSLGKSYKKLIVHNYSTLLYTYLRLVNSEGMLEHSVHEVRKLNARLNKNLDNYYGRGHNMPTEQNPEIYRTIKALTEIGEGYCQRVNERFAVLPD